MGLAVLVAALLLTALPREAAASQGGALTLKVSQSVASADGSSQKDVQVRYQLVSEGSNAPMPDGSSSGAYEFTLNENGSAEITWSHLTTPGSYRYLFEPMGASGAAVTSSPRRIELLLVVTNDGGTTEVQTAAYYPDGKKGELKFTQTIKDGGAASPGNASNPRAATDFAGKGGTPKTGDDSMPWVAGLLALGLSATSTGCLFALSGESERGSKKSS